MPLTEFGYITRHVFVEEHDLVLRFYDRAILNGNLDSKEFLTPQSPSLIKGPFG